MDRTEAEQEWLTGDGPGHLLDMLEQPGYPRVREYTEREFRLYSCACCRRIWHLMTFGTSRELIELVERYADGLTDAKSLEDATEKLYDAMATVPKIEGERRADWCAARAARYAGWSDPRGGHGSSQGAGYVHMRVWDVEYFTAGGDAMKEDAMWGLKERSEQALSDLLRDIFGNPFRQVAADPSWRTSTVVALAQQMYESRDFSPMPVLADALQDAGCDHPDVLDHCRGPGPHVRGCWVVDLILGKE